MSSSHELVHYIGGVEDTNHNITRRILLLIESLSLSDHVTHERVIRAILERYIVGDPPATTPAKFHVPLFLLNDIVRLWRTMTVDYATKKWQRSSAGWALRNTKLRMSRKLLFVKGMLLCFLCDEHFAGAPTAAEPELVQADLLRICFDLSRRPPVELLAETLLKYADAKTGKLIMGAYDRFLAMLNDLEMRETLKKLRFDEADNPLFEQQRQNTRDFRDGLETLFFGSNDRLTKLTQRYGVF
jgi:hypothetical protein